MKSFALHLVVVFILGAEYQSLWSFCSSTPASSASPTSLLSTSRSLLFREQRIAGILDSTANVQHPIDAKTSRKIQRLIAGHLQHLKSNTSLNPAVAYFRRKPNVSSTRLPQIKTTILKRVTQTTPSSQQEDLDYRDSALLEDTNDIDNWDSDILRLSAGAGRENNVKSKKKDDSKKTLADQVKDGKYGLIENELFKNVPKRPGVISYHSNEEVPDDNANNYGGLKDEDIWLAEDHLLVLKGGSLNADQIEEPWTPIDDYEAPPRQIKIPPNPKVPPPFPVQFEDNGPIQFVGDHKFPFFYPKDANESIPFFPGVGYASPGADDNNEKNFVTRPRTSQNVTGDQNSYFYPPAYPPWLFNNESFKNPFLNFAPPPQNPLPFDNGNDYIDEDDPSLYYPPPYSFVYKSNYSNPVKPGPLVPGIVLPPPADAFAKLEPQSQQAPVKSVPFSVILGKINDIRPNTTTTTELPHHAVTTTSLRPPVKSKETFYIRQRTRPSSNTITSRLQPPTTTTTTTTSIPPTQEIIGFVPQGPAQTDPLSTGKPVYYEYFDSRNVLPSKPPFSTPKAPVHGQFFNQVTKSNTAYQIPTVPSLPPTPKPYASQDIFSRPIYREPPSPTQRPIQTIQLQKPLRINPIYRQPQPYNYNEYLYITPKPEIYPNGISTNIIPQPPQQPFKIQDSFAREVDAIRQTLHYYKTQELQRNHASRIPKAKGVFEYDFEPTGRQTEKYLPSRVFTPPASYDAAPFKPMVQYSRPVNDANGFKGIAYPRNDDLSENQDQNIYYSSTPRTDSLNVELQVGDNLNNRVKAFTTPLNQQPATEYPDRDQRNYGGRTIQPPNQYIPQRTTVSPRQQWFSIEKQVVHEISPQKNPIPLRSVDQKDINRSISGFYGNPPRNQQPFSTFQGYYYTQPVQQRPNNRFQKFPESSFNKNAGAIRAQLTQYTLQQEQSVSLENDTFVNNLPGRTINPNAEYINLPPRRELFQQQRLPPVAPQNPGDNIHRKPVDLDSDILVNYKLPLPPINPDSEYIQPQFANHHQHQYFQRPSPIFPQYTGSTSRPVFTGNRSPDIYYVKPQRDFRYKGA